MRATLALNGLITYVFDVCLIHEHSFYSSWKRTCISQLYLRCFKTFRRLQMLTMQRTLLPLEKRRTFCDTRNFDDKVNYFLPFCHLIMALSMEFTT